MKQRDAKQTGRQVATEAGQIAYLLERKPVKNLNLRVRRDGSVYVSANPRVPLRTVDEFVQRQAQFVLRTREKLARQPREQQLRQYVSDEHFCLLGQAMTLAVVPAAPGEGEGVCLKDGQIRLAVRDVADIGRKERLFDQWLRQQCQAVFGEILARLYPLVADQGVAYPELRIRRMKARWGSCLVQKGVINLNIRLLEAPRECVEYVVLHELCHFIHPNHSPAFYALVGSFMPDWPQRRQKLNSII